MKKKERLPIDIALQENTRFANGAIFVRLPTIGSLRDFWQEREGEFNFAAKGIDFGDAPMFLRPYEWVFAPTKVALISTLTRWDEVGIRCEWYDWINDQSSDIGISHSQWFAERDRYRDRRKAAHLWTPDDEAEYRTDCQVRTPETYRGWWELVNLPRGLHNREWFGPWDFEEIIDPLLPNLTVKERMQEMTFDMWANTDGMETEVMDAVGVQKEIEYWLKEKSTGFDYYGSENE